MNALLLCIIVYAGFIIAYNTYGKFLGNKLFNLSKKALTPAHQVNDGIDYVPAKPQILIGHHFSSIAGAAPIIGPITAAVFGWVPVWLWIVLGGIFMGAVHDFSALVASVRHQGRSIGEVIDRRLGSGAKILLVNDSGDTVEKKCTPMPSKTTDSAMITGTLMHPLAAETWVTLVRTFSAQLTIAPSSGTTAPLIRVVYRIMMEI